ncbi:MAG TPA: DUF5947 family protein [Acidimicrobiales bacterium]|nr:DUF5947 family protein [Acidimicrobiales bacterium]
MTASPPTAGSANGSGPSPFAPGGDAGPLAVLSRLLRPAPGAAGEERCEMCAEPIPSDHSHVVDVGRRTLVCTCRACSLLFTGPGAGAGRYRTVPNRYRTVRDFALTASQWSSLRIPVAVAFFFENSSLDATAAFFPGPAGATECLLPLDTWQQVVAANPVLDTLEPDVEAALIRTDGGDSGAGVECFLVPIDSCYELVGHLRSLWRGFEGGREVHEAMAAYFDRLRARGTPVGRDGLDD